MATVDQIVAALADVPAAERVGWRFADEVSSLDLPVSAPQQPVPDWFRQGVEQAVRWLATSWPQRPLFQPIRALDRAGVVAPPHDDAYVLAMVSALGDRTDGQYRLDAIRTDPQLRDDLLWRVFEVEGGGEVSLTNVDKFSLPGCGWADAFRTLVADGTLPRDRVLAGCLAALGRDFSAYRAGFYSHLFDSFEPTNAEVTAAQDTLLGLLASAVPATASFAARHLATIELDEVAFLDACLPALVVPAKSTPLALLRLVATAAQHHPEPAVRAAAAALGHRHRDVQLAALKLLRSLDAGDLVAERLARLEPSVAQRAAEWFGLTRTAESPAPSLALDERPFERTPEERAAALLAGDTDPHEIELFLAEVAAGRATTELAGPARRALRHHGELRHVTAALLLGERPQLTHSGFLAGRIAEIQACTAPVVLLATPTDPAGWLDPATFVQRLEGTAAPMRYDLIAALLRLHPEGREVALRAAQDLPGDTGSAVRYALGGDPEAIGDHAIWVAAARTRTPLADDPHLIAAGLTGAGRGHAARLVLRVTSGSFSYPVATGVRTVVTWDPQVDIQPPAVPAADLPTVPVRGCADGDFIRWQARIWPHDAEGFFAAELGPAMWAADAENDGRSADRLDALLDHPGRLGPMAAAVIAAALTAQDAGCRTRAAEILATLVPSRIPVTDMSGAMSLLAQHATASRWAAALRNTSNPHVVIAVLGCLLPQLPHSHPGLHALITTLLEECVRVSAGSLFAEPSGGTLFAASPKVLLAWLRHFTGSSKAARTARELLTLAGA